MRRGLRGCLPKSQTTNFRPRSTSGVPLALITTMNAAEKHRARGERFWWYICTGPKAPYCTLFIDHPATELRVWLWQTWQRNISGILIWQTNYWTSEAAYPDSFQNPYEDPMSYVSGYSTPKGVKRHWGNGDGRFIYPPLAAAVPGGTESQPVLEPPVSSIRWENAAGRHRGLRDALSPAGTVATAMLINCRAERQAAYTKLLQVPPEITRSTTSFTFDPRPILKHREAVARAITELNNLE